MCRCLADLGSVGHGCSGRCLGGAIRRRERAMVGLRNRNWMALSLAVFGLLSASSFATVTFDFETEDDLVTPLVNGQDLSSPPEFGTIFTISGTGGLGPAIFDSTDPGPNSAGPDADLLVNSGNLVIVQDTSAPTQTVPGIFDTPNDQVGGSISFDFSVAPAAPGAVSIDLVDINGGGMLVITLTDTSSLTRVFSVPDEWTGAIDIPPAPGIGTLMLNTTAPQPPVAGAPGVAPATAVEDPGFDETSLSSILISFGGSGGVDNLVLDLCVNAMCQAANPPCEGGEVCNENTGQCEAQPDAPSGTDCENDGDLCTAELCDGNGACMDSPGDDVTCAPAVPPCEGGELCNPSTGMCEEQPDAPSGTDCENDGDLCTAELCDGNGACMDSPGDDVTCAPAVPPCEGGELCNPSSGMCEEQPDAPSGTDCENDGDLCTAELCDGNGACMDSPGDDVTCAPAVPPCEGGELCNPSSGMCEEQPDAPSGTDCENDGDLCTAELCDGNGACMDSPGDDVTCAPAVPPCEGGELCNPSSGMCEEQPDAPSGTDCENDGDLCTAELCDGNGACMDSPGDDVTCAPADPPCEGGELCNPSTGLCEEQPDAPSGTDCENDGDLCTAELCDGNGMCADSPGDDVTCAPADPPCEGGELCNPSTGLCEEQPDAPSGTDCENDGDLCTAELCDGNGMCADSPGNDVTCAPADPPCEGGELCNPSTGLCEEQPDAPSGTDCENDGDLCTAELCDGNGACMDSPGDDVTCAPADPPCEGGELCNPSTGMCEEQADAPSGTDCENDGDLCTAELCDGNGMCADSPGDDVTCAPADPPCEGGELCNPSTGLCEEQPDAPSGTDCENDGDLCTAELCDGNGMCADSPGDDVTCAPADPPCEGGELCNPSTGMCEEQADAPSGTNCENDGDLCTAELCDGNGACVDSPGDDVTCAPADPPCDGGEVCVPSTGVCEPLPDAPAGTSCQADGDPCTIDVCDGFGDCMSIGEACGACCMTDGTCADGLTSAQCVASSGLFNGIGSECEGDVDGNGIDDACETPPVPTMSTPGMMLLLVLLAIGLAMQVRRQGRRQLG